MRIWSNVRHSSCWEREIAELRSLYTVHRRLIVCKRSGLDRKLPCSYPKINTNAIHLKRGINISNYLDKGTDYCKDDKASLYRERLSYVYKHVTDRSLIDQGPANLSAHIRFTIFPTWTRNQSNIYSPAVLNQKPFIETSFS